MLEILISRLIALGDGVRLEHWGTSGPGSFARHTALGDFYDALSGKLDEIVEISIGINGPIKAVEPRAYTKSGINKQIADVMNWTSANRSKIAGGNAIIENQLDELGAIFSRTLYKLERLA